MIYDVIIVGGGVAGLTSSAFLAKAGYSTLLLEQATRCGGLVNTFSKDGFTYDGGIRALDNAGALFPMLKQLGITMEFLPNPITIGIEDQVIHVDDDLNLCEYQVLLEGLFPQSREDIADIIVDIKTIMRHMKIQYGIDNPLFLDFRKDRDYFIKEVFPWIFRYLFTVGKVNAKNRPVGAYLQGLTNNQSLVDIISQHFFTDTPAFFALSYFNLYRDYIYPKGGTGVFSKNLADFISRWGGEIKTGSEVTSINPEKKVVTTGNGSSFEYRCMVWAADQKTLYERINTEEMSQEKTLTSVGKQKALLAGMQGNDSVLTVYLGSNLEKDYFENIASGHFFYTPNREGQSRAGANPVSSSWEDIIDWLERFFALTTYEISIPVLRDSSLAPPGKTGLIISVLFDYQLTKTIIEQGQEVHFREFAAKMMINTLDRSIYPGLAGSVIDRFCSTPLTIEKLTGNSDGAITGWSFSNQPMPAENRLVKIAKAVNTPLTDVYQAGQWTYSPSGLPISLITGKLAADKIRKRIRPTASHPRKI
jgi:phytoene dehydrogenase-like protein